MACKTQRLPLARLGLRRKGPLVIAFLAFVLSIWAPGPVTITADEPLWLVRTDRFRHALAGGDLRNANSILPGALIGHQTSPGVTTMWAGTVGHGLVRLGQRLGVVEERPHGALTRQLTLRAGRGVVSLLCAIAIGLFTVSAARIVGRRAALAAGALLAIEPFVVGHAGVLHTDAMAALWGATAVVAFATAVSGAHLYRPGLVLSAVAAGVSILTKANSVAFVGGGVAVVLSLCLVTARVRRVARPSGRSLLLGIAAWAGLVAAVIVALWPAMWVAPVQSIRQSIDAFGQLNSFDRTYFRGEITADPGPAFYPVALLVRTTPWLIALAAGGLVAILRNGISHSARWRTRSVLTAILIAAPIPYLVAINFASQRYDRYTLVAVPFLALAAGVAVSHLATLIGARRGWTRRTGWAGLAVLAALTAAQAPYAIAYINPLVGPTRAEHLILLGWGEGIERLGAEIARREAGRCDEIDVLVGIPATSVAVPCGRLDVLGSPASGDGEFEYAIRYVYQRQAHTLEDLYRGIEQRSTRIGVVRIRGVTYAELWKVEPPS